jgi:predicted outer membrane protein
VAEEAGSMDIALSTLRSVLLGALGGLAAFAFALWLGWMPAARPALPSLSAQPAALVHSGGAQARLSKTDLAPASETARRFIVEAAGASLYDAQAALVVQARATDAAVQDLAALLLRDHALAWPALDTLARSCGVELPAVPTAAQRQTLALMRDVAEHTRAHLFVRHVGVESTLSEIARFEAALEVLDDADASLRGWIEQTLPALRERAALSQRLLPRVAERRPMA